MEIIKNNIDIIVLLIFSLIGIGFIIYHSIIILKGKKTLTWTKVNGIITSSEIGISQNVFKQTYENYYRADIDYKYEIYGNKYDSNNIFLGDKTYLPHKRKAKKTLEMFPIGKKVEVYVNPDNHTESILIPGSGNNRIFRIIVGIGFIATGILIKSNFEIVLEVIKAFENIGK